MNRRQVVLTARGVGMTVVGSMMLTFGIMIGVPVVTTSGSLLLLLVLGGVAAVGLPGVAAARGGVRMVRRVIPHPVTVGEPATVEVVLTSTAPLARLSGLEISEQAARELSGSGGLRARVHREPGRLRLSYPIMPARRGRWAVGPLQVRRSDLFGVAHWRGPLGEPMQVAVRPRIHPVVGDTRAESTDVDRAATGTRMPAADDALLRDYRPGDDLRRVHWRSSARRGELLVRQDERAARRPASVVLDLPRDDPAAEWSISLAASVAVALVRSGHRVRLLGGDVLGTSTDHHPPDTEGVAVDAILDQTVDLTLPPTPFVRDEWLRVAVDTLSQEGSGAELVFAVVGGLDPDALAALARLGDANLGWAMVRTGTDPSRNNPDHLRTLEALRRAGWTVCPVDVGEDIPLCWARLRESDSRTESLR